MDLLEGRSLIQMKPKRLNKCLHRAPVMFCNWACRSKLELRSLSGACVRYDYKQLFLLATVLYYHTLIFNLSYKSTHHLQSIRLNAW